MFEMIMDAVMPYIFEIIIALISLTVSYHVIPFIKTDFIPWLKEKRLYSIVKTFVQAAEKMAESGFINKDDKKKKVIDLLNSKGIVVDDVVDSFIESFVLELSKIPSAVHEELMEEETDNSENLG